MTPGNDDSPTQSNSPSQSTRPEEETVIKTEEFVLLASEMEKLQDPKKVKPEKTNLETTTSQELKSTTILSLIPSQKELAPRKKLEVQFNEFIIHEQVAKRTRLEPFPNRQFTDLTSNFVMNLRNAYFLGDETEEIEDLTIRPLENGPENKAAIRCLLHHLRYHLLSLLLQVSPEQLSHLRKSRNVQRN